MKNKKTLTAIVSVVAFILITVGITYAYWVVTKTQIGENILGAACLDISLSGNDNITLEEQYPISDEDGLKTTPYEFTITNNCNNMVDFQINLESLGDAETSLSVSSLKIALNDKVALLSDKASVEATQNDAYDSRIIGMSKLNKKGTEGSSATYNLKLWIDKDAPVSEQGKSYRSKLTVSVGQDIKASFEEGTLAYEIVSQYGGEKMAAVQTGEYRDGLWGNEISTAAYSSKYWYGTEYTLNTTTGKYSLSGEVVQASIDECRNGTVNCGPYTFNSSNKNYSYGNIIYKVTNFKSNLNDDSGSAKYFDYRAMSSVNDFTDKDASGLFKAKDNASDSYYLSGNITNNYVKLGTWKEDRLKVFLVDESEDHALENTYFGWNGDEGFDSMSECNAAISNESQKCYELKYGHVGDPMYWRILRINGDGTIRLIYDGTEAYDGTETFFDRVNTIGQSNYSDNAGVAYTNYSLSNLKTYIDSWYVTNLKDKEGLLADGQFCNDTTFTKRNTLVNSVSPSLVCSQSSDVLTVENGRLTYPIAIMSADEAFMAGSTKSKGYINSQTTIWTMTTMDIVEEYVWPEEGDPEDGANMFAEALSDDSGQTILDWTSGPSGRNEVRPVINIKANAKFTGSGTKTDPYILSID